jgi:hypothetical protein
MASNPVVGARMTATIEGDFVVFLIGMRINKLWKVRSWFPVAKEMPPMMAELMKHPELGLLGYRITLGARGPVTVQYWRTAEQLMAFARGSDLPHLAAWRRFNKAVGSNGDVGIWHETYLVPAGGYEAIYNNMPRTGLAAAGQHEPVARRGETAAKRLRAG